MSCDCCVWDVCGRCGRAATVTVVTEDETQLMQANSCAGGCLGRLCLELWRSGFGPVTVIPLISEREWESIAHAHGFTVAANRWLDSPHDWIARHESN